MGDSLAASLSAITGSYPSDIVVNLGLIGRRGSRFPCVQVLQPRFRICFGRGERGEVDLVAGREEAAPAGFRTPERRHTARPQRFQVPARSSAPQNRVPSNYTIIDQLELIHAVLVDVRALRPGERYSIDVMERY